MAPEVEGRNEKTKQKQVANIIIIRFFVKKDIEIEGQVVLQFHFWDFGSVVFC